MARPSEDLKIGLAYDTGGRGDRSFNDSAYAGVEAAIEANGGEVSELSPNADASNRADLLTQLADQGYNPVIAVGFAYGDVIGDVAEQYPDTNFAIIDSSVAEIGADNLTGLLFAEEQGSFLAGVAAALKTTTNHIGFVGGVETPLIEKFEAGYFAGAQAVKPDITIDSSYLTPAGDFSGFNDPAKGQIAAQGMFDARCRHRLPRCRWLRASACSRRPPPRTSAPSVSTPTSTTPSTTRPSRP